jgi:hypothetical protein
MKRNHAGLVIVVAVLFFVVGCDRGPPTLVPTFVNPPTHTPMPSDTPEPTAVLPQSPTQIPTATPVPIATVRRQATLRSGPGVDYAVAGSVPFGQSLIVYAQCDGWFQVSDDAGLWIIAGKVILSVEQDKVPHICRVPVGPN